MPTNGIADGILYTINGAPVFTYGMITITAVVLAYVTFAEAPDIPNENPLDQASIALNNPVSQIALPFGSSPQEPVNTSPEEPVNPSPEEPVNPSPEQPVNGPLSPSPEEPVTEPLSPSPEQPVNAPLSPSPQEPVTPPEAKSPEQAKQGGRRKKTRGQVIKKSRKTIRKT